MNPLDNCMHCGLCLEECPTYLVSGDETNSPRGRLFLMRAVENNELEFSDIAESLDKCLACGACETACPSGVPYTHILEQQREGRQSAMARLLQRRLLSSHLGVRAVGILSRLGRRLGILNLIGKLGIQRLTAMSTAVPMHPQRFRSEPNQTWRADGELRGRVGLHVGCANGELFGDVLNDTIRLFNQQGFEVVRPPQPPCCGALHSHSGDSEFGRELAQTTMQAFDGELDAVIVAAAGCAAHLRASGDSNKPASKAQDPVVFLHQRGWRGNPQRVAMRATHSPPCHLRNLLGEDQIVTQALAQLPGLELLTLNEAEMCCGAGGVSFIRQPQVAAQVGDRKLDNIVASGTECVISGNPGCLMKLSADLRQRGLLVKALHPVTVLANAFSD